MEKVQTLEPALSIPDGDTGQPAPPHNFLTRHRFGFLFLALLLFFVIVPTTHQFRDVCHPAFLLAVETTMFAMVIGGVSLSISRTRAWKMVTVALGLPTVGLWVLHIAIPVTAMEVVRYLATAGFLGYAIVLMLVAVFNARRVTINILAASLCSYLLMGIVWALGYSVLSLIDSHSFLAMVAGGAPAKLRVGPDSSMEALYFSFATLTTLGYGDIVPAAPLSRAMACLEALFGQLYLAVLVARLVGLHIVHEIGQSPLR